MEALSFVVPLSGNLFYVNWAAQEAAQYRGANRGALSRPGPAPRRRGLRPRRAGPSSSSRR